MDGTNESDGGGRNRLLNDLTSVFRSAEQLLRGGAQSGEDRDAALANIVATLGAAKDSVYEVEQRVVAGARDAVDSTHRYVRRNPWQAIGIGAAVGVAIGLAIGRRR